MKRPVTLESIEKQCRKIVRECEQTINDAEYWNGLPHNQQHTPIDVENFRLHLAWALGVLKQIQKRKATR